MGHADNLHKNYKRFSAAVTNHRNAIDESFVGFSTQISAEDSEQIVVNSHELLYLLFSCHGGISTASFAANSSTKLCSHLLFLDFCFDSLILMYSALACASKPPSATCNPMNSISEVMHIVLMSHEFTHESNLVTQT